MIDLNSILGTLANTPTWQYQLGLGEQQQQGMGTAANYLLGKGQNENQATNISNQYTLGKTAQQNQLDEFLKSLGLQKNQQDWQQGFSTDQFNYQKNQDALSRLDNAAQLSGADATAKVTSQFMNRNGIIPAARLADYYAALGAAGATLPSTATRIYDSGGRGYSR